MTLSLLLELNPIRRRSKWLCMAVLLSTAIAPVGRAQDREAIPGPELAGTIRISGGPADRGLLDALQAGFRRINPAVSFTRTLHGPESTLAGVYTGSADLALMGRELREPMERMAYEWAMLGRPLSIDVAEAGMRDPRLLTQIGIFVHQDNPLDQLSLQQLDAIYGAEQRRGASQIRDWGQLLANPRWKDRAIHVYGPAVDGVQALHIRTVVLQDSRKWNPSYRQLDSEGPEIISAVARDPYAIGFAPVRDAVAGVKLLALAEHEAGPFQLPGPDSIRAGTYPLGRSLCVVPAHTSEKPMRPEVKAFIAFLLGHEGQAIFQAEGSYLPLADGRAASELAKLP